MKRESRLIRRKAAGNRIKISHEKKERVMENQKQYVSVQLIESKIHLIRGQKVMLSPHLAELYQVEPRALVQAVEALVEAPAVEAVVDRNPRNAITPPEETENTSSPPVVPSAA